MNNGSANGLHPDVPLNLQIYSLLRQEIEDGVWAGRTDFPGEANLAERYGVSVITSRSALERLAKEGLVQRGRGRQTVAMPVRREAKESASLMMPGADDRVFTYRLLNAGLGVPPAEACDAYGVPPGTELWICRRLRRFEGRPHSVTLNVQLPAVGSRHKKKALASLPMAESLRQIGMEYTQMKRRISVGFPSPDVAQHLAITIQDPTLIYTFMLLDAASQPIEWVRIYVHPREQQHWETFDVKAPQGRQNARV